MLVVEDNPTNRYILEHHLETAGMATAGAADGQQAIALLQEATRQGKSFDLAIVDMKMPGMSGIEFARAVRADSTLLAPKLVMLASMSMPGQKAAASAAGFLAHLSKPVRQRDLYQCIAEVMGMPDEVGPDPLAEAAAPASQLQDVSHLQDVRVLLAEDNPVNQEVAIAMMEEFGCHFEIADNGREALAALERAAFDVVLMDCQMPDMDGFQATAEIRRRGTVGRAGGPVPIVALTANAMKGDRDACLAAGMDDYLAKPFSAETLRLVLEQWSADDQALAAAPEAEPFPKQPAEATTGVIEPKSLDNIRKLQRKRAPSLLLKVIQIYLGSAPQILGNMHRAVAAADAAALANAAHALKSSSANLGATRLAALCKSLEAEARSGKATEANAQVLAIEAEYRAVCAALASIDDRQACHAQSERHGGS